jgi:hypothetical protein
MQLDRRKFSTWGKRKTGGKVMPERLERRINWSDYA